MSTAASSVRDSFRPGGRRVPGAPVEKAKDIRRTLPRLVAFFRPDREYVILLGFAVMWTVAAGVIAPSLQSSAIDKLVGGAYRDIPPILGLMLLAYLIVGGGNLLQSFLSSKLTQRVIYRLRADLFRKVISLPIPSSSVCSMEAS